MISPDQLAPIKYWYAFHWSECVLCGRSKSWKERISDKPKPEDPHERHIQEPAWACDDHFR
ncbi:hypothetical protein LCGC14_2122790 [marine sediment metagenome]|uniref:Uncharacterized protein n=1 Tax=marine sediment metagenome TaxID=412755 RepID=A0A0F9GZY8_9ZZZZ